MKRANEFLGKKLTKQKSILEGKINSDHHIFALIIKYTKRIIAKKIKTGEVSLIS